MNAWGITAVWAMLQVTIFMTAAAIVYGLARRRGPSSGSTVATVALVGAIGVWAFAISPWPTWWTVGSISTEFSPPPTPASSVNELLPSPDQTVAAEPVRLVESKEMQPPTAIAPDSTRVNYWETLLKELQHPHVEVETSWRWPAWVAVALLAGVLMAFVRIGIALNAVRRYRTHTQRLDDPEVNSEIAELVRRLDCRKSLEVREVPELNSPATIGWRRPLILLPATWRDWTHEERQAVLAHEIAHVVRCDYLSWLLAQCSLAVNFFHPLIHWFVYRVRLEQELAADAMATQAVGGRINYLNTLANLALNQDNRRANWGARPFFSSRGTLLRRISMLRQPQFHDRPFNRTSRVTLLIVMLGICIGLTSVRAPVVTNETLAATPKDNQSKPSNDKEGSASQPKADIPSSSLPTNDLLSELLPDSPHDQEAQDPDLPFPETDAVQLPDAEDDKKPTAATKPAAPATNPARPAMTRWRRADLPAAPYRIQPGDRLRIDVVGTLAEQPIAGQFVVEPGGTVSLGPAYGRLKLQGFSLEEAETAMDKYLRRVLSEPEVSVTMTLSRLILQDHPPTPYKIAPGHLLSIQVVGTLVDQPMHGVYLVEPSGKVSLGPAYGRVAVAGQSLEEAEKTVDKQLRQILASPEVAITLAGWEGDSLPKSLVPPDTRIIKIQRGHESAENGTPATSATVRALLRLAPSTMSDSDFPIYKRTQAALLKSNYVLQATLRKPEVKRLALIEQHKDNVMDWLTREVIVDFPGDSETMQVSMNGQDHEQLATIVNAVVESYVREIVEAEVNDRSRQESSLKAMSEKLKKQVAEARKSGLAEKEKMELEKVREKMLAELQDFLKSERAKVPKVKWLEKASPKPAAIDRANAPESTSTK